MKVSISKTILPVILAATLLLTACQKATPTEDPALKITQIAGTLVAEMTQNAALIPSATPTATIAPTATMAPPTPTLEPTQELPTATPTTAPVKAASKADNSIWVEDTTIPDGTIVKPGATFTKIWKVKNTGTNLWTGDYYTAFVDGIQANAFKVPFAHTVKPDFTLEIAVEFTAPTTPGTYYSYWRMYNPNREPFGEPLSMKIVVGNP